MKPGRLPPSEQKSCVLEIETLGRQGEGLARADGRRIYVAGSLPGETVRATLREQMDRAVFKATLDEVLDASSHRVAPPCPYYDACGGCALQHMDDSAYRDWKTTQIRTALAAAGLVPEQWDAPIFIPQGTRRRATFVVLKQGKTVSAGFHGARSHKIVAIESCLVLDPVLIRILEDSKPWLLRLLSEGKPADLMLQTIDGQVEGVLTGVLAGSRDAGLWVQESFAHWAKATGLARLSYRRDSRDDPEVMIQKQPFMAQFGPLNVSLPPAVFLQPSEEGEDALTDTVRAMLADGRVGGKAGDGPFLDLFAGCGTFSGLLLSMGRTHAVEMDPSSVRALDNTKTGSALSVEKRDLYTAPLMGAELNRYATVLLDPPRAGAQAQCAALARSKVASLIYVSCNPSSFRRDAALLTAGGYRLRRLRVIDQFIWSAHTELVALLTR